MEASTENKIKPGKFFYVLAIISCLGAIWLLIANCWPSLSQSFSYPLSSFGVYFIVITWVGVVIQLCALAGGIMAFRSPKFAWFFLMAGAMGNSFLLFRFIDTMRRIWIDYWLVPLPKEQGLKFHSLYIDVFFTALSFVMMFFIFFSRPAKGIKTYKKLIFVSSIILVFILLHLFRPTFGYE